MGGEFTTRERAALAKFAVAGHYPQGIAALLA
jgi:hypothetical protein